MRQWGSTHTNSFDGDIILYGDSRNNNKKGNNMSETKPVKVVVEDSIELDETDKRLLNKILEKIALVESKREELINIFNEFLKEAIKTLGNDYDLDRDQWAFNKEKMSLIKVPNDPQLREEKVEGQ